MSDGSKAKPGGEGALGVSSLMMAMPTPCALVGAGGRVEHVNAAWASKTHAIAALAAPGADLAGACDMRIMSDEAFFQWAYILNGLVPVDGGMWLLPRIVGQAKAMEWMLTGDRVYAEEALRTGLVNHVVPKEKLLETTMALAAKIAERSPSAVQSTRFGINAGATLSMQDAVGLSYLSGYSTFRDMRSSIQRRAENI